MIQGFGNDGIPSFLIEISFRQMLDISKRLRLESNVTKISMIILSTRIAAHHFTHIVAYGYTQVSEINNTATSVHDLLSPLTIITKNRIEQFFQTYYGKPFSGIEFMEELKKLDFKEFAAKTNMTINDIRNKMHSFNC